MGVVFNEIKNVRDKSKNSDSDLQELQKKRRLLIKSVDKKIDDLFDLVSKKVS